MRKKFLLLMSFVAMFAAWQLVQVKQVWADSKLKVVTTFYPVYEFTKNVVGDKADVSMLIKAGTEPHDFEPSTKNIAAIQDSNAFVYMDDNMETWAPKVAKSVKSKKVTTIKGTGDMLLTKGVEEEGEDHEHEGHGHEGHHHELDPHVWLSPERAISVVENIRNKFVKAYPKDAASFNKNADAYIAKLKDLDKEYKNGLSNAKQKSFVTQHAAFGYMALDYGLNQVPIAGLTPDAEPSSKRLGELAKYIKKYNIN
ncbi:zinc ABC transporter solute-binding protein, partial [Streptococcus agalactiae]|nr:zinc ABC transporter solute-binding protein [Streptococcus agalactiae]